MMQFLFVGKQRLITISDVSLLLKHVVTLFTTMAEKDKKFSSEHKMSENKISDRIYFRPQNFRLNSFQRTKFQISVVEL